MKSVWVIELIGLFEMIRSKLILDGFFVDEEVLTAFGESPDGVVRPGILLCFQQVLIGGREVALLVVEVLVLGVAVSWVIDVDFGILGCI